MGDPPDCNHIILHAILSIYGSILLLVLCGGGKEASRSTKDGGTKTPEAATGEAKTATATAPLPPPAPTVDTQQCMIPSTAAPAAKPPDGADNRKLWAHKIWDMKPIDLANEFNNLVKPIVDPKLTKKAYDANPNLNRYGGEMYCSDATRVILKERDADSDYINASWVTIPGHTAPSYICAQGPMDHTCEDFWHLVFTEKLKTVVMLCNFQESGQDKCCKYFPMTTGQRVIHGIYEVFNKETKKGPREDVKVTTIIVQKGNKKNILTHVWATAWPDQLAPSSPDPVIELWRYVKSINEPASTPILVHCSAGIGRTSTFVCIDFASAVLKKHGTSFIDVVRELRYQRHKSVQTHVQYLFLHVCMLEVFAQDNIIQRTTEYYAFRCLYQKHADRKLEKRKSEDIEIEKEERAKTDKTKRGKKKESKEDEKERAGSRPGSRPGSKQTSRKSAV